MSVIGLAEEFQPLLVIVTPCHLPRLSRTPCAEDTQVDEVSIQKYSNGIGRPNMRPKASLEVVEQADNR